MSFAPNEAASRLDRARSLMASVDELPTVPDIVLRIAGKLNDTEVSVDEVTDLLFQDQVLTARVLRLVNSPLYSPVKTISTLREAVIYLGLDHLKEAIFTCAIVDLFKAGKGVFSRSALWAHALGVARVAKIIAEMIDLPNPGNAYIAGLLHDVGAVFLNFYLGQDFARVVDLVESEGVSFFDAENRLLGVSHCEIGLTLAARWHLDDFISDAIRYHHDLNATPPENAAVVAIVNIADLFCTIQHLGYEGCNITIWNSGELEGRRAWDVLRESIPNPWFDKKKVLAELNASIVDVRAGVDDLFTL